MYDTNYRRKHFGRNNYTTSMGIFERLYFHTKLDFNSSYHRVIERKVPSFPVNITSIHILIAMGEDAANM